MSDKKSVELEKEKLRLEYLFDYGIDIENRIITITGEIEEYSFDFVNAAMCEMEKSSKRKVKIRINSPGGSVYEALAIVGRLTSSPCYIETEVYGQCMSAAVLVLACGNKRRMSKYAWFMHHKASYVLEGDHDSIKEAFDQAEKEEDLWCHWMEEFSTSQIATKEFWKQVTNKTNYYATAEACLDLGIIDEVI